MKVAAIEQRDLYRRPLEDTGGRQAAKATADDHHPVTDRRIDRLSH